MPQITHVPGTQPWMLGVANVRGTLFDLPEGVEAAKRGAGGPLPGVTFTAGNVFESVPEGADA